MAFVLCGNWLPRLDLHQDIRCQRPAHCWLCNEAMVAREGSAPSISGCRPDVILFHHQAEIGCRGWNCTSIRAFKGRCPTIRRPGNKWWPARVTRPVLRIKSPLHHFNACRPKIGSPGRSSKSEDWCSWQGSHLHWRRSRRRASAGWATRAEFGAPTRNGLPKSCKSGAPNGTVRSRELQCTEFIRLPSECIARNALGA